MIGLFVLCFMHSNWVHGWKRTLREFSAGFFLTAMVENIGVLCGAYVYPGFHFYVYATPLLNPASWVAIVYVVIEFTNRIVYGPRSLQTYEVDGFSEDQQNFTLFKGPFIKTLVLLAAIDASLLVMIDLIEDPLASIYNWWIWVPCAEGVNTITAGVIDPYNFSNHVWMETPDNPISRFIAQFFPNGMRYPTRPLGIPLTNFIDWFLLVFMFSLSFRWVEFKHDWSDLKKTIVLWGFMIAIIIIMPFTILMNL
ncbi:MAG: hypothetical protein U9P80_04450 [Thermodesulfobacteriota bacterium]|nr:hypothetical protein [Thermodesulfobacteriota bacterium]